MDTPNNKIKTWFAEQIGQRDLVESRSEKVSIVQIIGFILIVSAVFILMYQLQCNDGSISKDSLAILFFVIMLGYSMAFPSLLRDPNKGISTMRIVVFMMVNVICLLLIKIGWSAGDFSLIKIDEYWMGIIAFIFGAKATQSFFESKMAVAPKTVSSGGMSTVKFTYAEIVKLAIIQNKDYLTVKFPNILTISDTVDDLSKTASHFVTIYLIDNNDKGIPLTLETKMPDGRIELVKVEVVKDVGEGGIHGSQSDKIQTEGSPVIGSICCMVEMNSGKKALISAGHVCSGLYATNYGGWLNSDQSRNVILNGSTTIGKWKFQQITSSIDVALIELNEEADFNQMVSFADTGLYDISDSSIKQEVTLNSCISRQRKGFILDFNTTWPVQYTAEIQNKTNIILVGSSPDRDNSKTLSEAGDSGGVVYHSETGKLVGIILGGNKKYTWVLPLTNFINKYEFNFI